ncbi:MAG: hypothetical protein HKN08_08430 [Gammaproteobacteria bacterium]|nr:hypothetical protein [Gammaproteobacteria bacterium]
MAIDRMENSKSVSNLLNQAANRFPNIYLLDLNDLACPEDICSAITADNVIVFRDSQHLTDSFVRSQVPFIRQRLESLNSDWNFTELNINQDN